MIILGMKSRYTVQQTQLLVSDVSNVIFSTNLPNVMLPMPSGMVWLVEFGGVNVDANIAWPSLFFCFITGNMYERMYQTIKMFHKNLQPDINPAAVITYLWSLT